MSPKSTSPGAWGFVNSNFFVSPSPYIVDTFVAEGLRLSIKLGLAPVRRTRNDPAELVELSFPLMDVSSLVTRLTSSSHVILASVAARRIDLSSLFVNMFSDLFLATVDVLEVVFRLLGLGALFAKDSRADNSTVSFWWSLTKSGRRVISIEFSLAEGLRIAARENGIVSADVLLVVLLLLLLSKACCLLLRNESSVDQNFFCFVGRDGNSFE